MSLQRKNLFVFLIALVVSFTCIVLATQNHAKANAHSLNVANAHAQAEPNSLTFQATSETSTHTATIKQITDSGFQFALTVGTPTCTGDVQGQATWVTDHSAEVATVAGSPDAPDCDLIFLFARNQLTLREQQCPYHGIACDFNSQLQLTTD
ncbi:MAG: hypothetical protein AAGF24_05020 [Cyanobacteria bacterium P01_H01_bin.121]